MTKIFTRQTNTGTWEFYGEVRSDEVTYHCRKLREMGARYIRVRG
jgi:hypothetical protein